MRLAWASTESRHAGRYAATSYAGTTTLSSGGRRENMADRLSPRDRASLTDAATYPRKVLFVAGAGRSGTSTLAGLMRIMGLHVPQPEVAADETNPKGFGEPRWVVDHHDRLLKEALVQVSDSRPEAWFETGRVTTREHERIATAEWLESHFQVSPELVVKDPRLGWFLGLWRVAAVRTGATPVFATMLRPPSEVVGSKQTYYANRLGSAHLAASWLNMMLHTERGTRESVADGGRVFVRYEDLLADWVKTSMHVAETLQLQHVLHADSEQIREGHRFVDPSLRRMSQTLADLGLPKQLHELTAGTWEELNKLADPGGDTPASTRHSTSSARRTSTSTRSPPPSAAPAWSPPSRASSASGPRARPSRAARTGSRTAYARPSRPRCAGGSARPPAGSGPTMS